MSSMHHLWEDTLEWPRPCIAFDKILIGLGCRRTSAVTWLNAIRANRPSTRQRNLQGFSNLSHYLSKFGRIYPLTSSLVCRLLRASPPSWSWWIATPKAPILNPFRHTTLHIRWLSYSSIWSVNYMAFRRASSQTETPSLSVAFGVNFSV